MTLQEAHLVNRWHESYKNVCGKMYQVFVIDDILMLLLMAAMQQVVMWIVRKCLDSNFSKHRAARLVKWSCHKCFEMVEVEPGHWTPERLYTEHGEKLVESLEIVCDATSPKEVGELKIMFAQPAVMGMLPEGA